MKNVYIVLSRTGTIFSRLIGLYTKDEYNHSAIAFDSSLKVMYSFGRNKRFNIFDNGFKAENFHEGLYVYFPNAKCCVLEVPVSDQEYDAMQEEVQSFIKQKNSYRYNLLGVIIYPIGFRLKRDKHYFCSEFVSRVMTRCQDWNAIPEKTKPMDFYRKYNERLIYEGNILKFGRIS